MDARLVFRTQLMHLLKVAIGCGTRSLLSEIFRRIDRSQIRVIALYESPAEALIGKDTESADVWIFDARMLRQLVKAQPEALAALRQTSCIVLLLQRSELRRAAGLAEHADGFTVLADQPQPALMLSLQVACAGYAVLPPGLLSEDASARLAARRLTSLSPRERAVLGLLGQGLSNAEIAGRLSITKNNVRYAVTRILAKLELHNRTDAGAFAAQQGLAPGSSTGRAGGGC